MKAAELQTVGATETVEESTVKASGKVLTFDLTTGTETVEAGGYEVTAKITKTGETYIIASLGAPLNRQEA
jgi:hypothetical protein